MRKWRVIVPLLIVVVLGFAIASARKKAALPAYEYQSVRYAYTNESGRPVLEVFISMGVSESEDPVWIIGHAQRLFTSNGWSTNMGLYRNMALTYPPFEGRGEIMLPPDVLRWQDGSIVYGSRMILNLRKRFQSDWSRRTLIFLERLMHGNSGPQVVWGPEMDAAEWMRWHPVETIYPKVPYRAIDPVRDCR